MNKIPRKKLRGCALGPDAAHVSAGPAPAPRPIPIVRGSSNTRESPLGFHVCHVPKDRDRLESRKRPALTGRCVVPEQPRVRLGRGSAAECRSFIEALVIGSASRRSPLLRGGGGARPGRGVAEGAGEPRSRLRTETQVRRWRGWVARTRHAVESLPRRGGRG